MGAKPAYIEPKILQVRKLDLILASQPASQWEQTLIACLDVAILIILTHLNISEENAKIDFST